MSDDRIVLRPARHGDDGQSVFDLTWVSVKALAKDHYPPEVIANWMGERTPAFYEKLIANGLLVVAEQGGAIVGFVDAEPGEVTRLFVQPNASGRGLGRRLLQIGIEQARRGHEGRIKVEATLNAVGFYEKHGFKILRSCYSSHNPAGPPISLILMEL
jgi:ribosomal protein S18 acetylase RimI-like enzyme